MTILRAVTTRTLEGTAVFKTQSVQECLMKDSRCVKTLMETLKDTFAKTVVVCE